MENFLDTQAEQSAGFVDATDVYEPEYKRPANLDAEAILKEEETPEQASLRIDQQANETFQTVASRAIDSREDPAQVASTIVDQESKLFGIYSKDDIYIEDDVISKSGAYRSAEQRFYRNLQILSEEMEAAAAEQKDRSWVGYGLDFVDREIIRATTFGWYENLTNRTAREGNRVFGSLVGTADPKEMRKFAKEYVDEIRAEGIGSENYFAYAQMLREVYGLGYNPDAAWDKFFGALDLAGFAGVAGSLGKITRTAALRGTTVANRAGLLGGVEEANAAARNIYRRDIDPQNLTNMHGSAVDLNQSPVRPSFAESIRLFFENKIIQESEAATASGGVLRATERTVDLQTIARSAAEAFSRAFKVNVYDAPIVKLTEDITEVQFLIGKNSDGTPFRPLADGSAPSGAKKIADKVNGEVVPVNPDDLSQGYVVKVSEAVDSTQGLKGGFNIKLANTAWKRLVNKVPFFERILGSAAARDVEELNYFALRSQSAAKFLNNEGMKQQRIIDKLSANDQAMLDDILSDLRDGPDVNRTVWDENLFSAHWRARTGETPSTDVIRAFRAAQTLSDAAYYFRAMEIMQTYVRKNFRNSVEVADGVFVPARRTTLASIPQDAKLYDATDSARMRKQDYSEFDQDTVVWELSSPWNDQEYVILAQNVRTISPRDVLGYSAYGRRTNPEARYFLFIQSERGVKTVLTAFSDKTARIAREELSNIQRLYKEGASDDVIEEAIQRNNTWNPNINTKDDMDVWLDENGIDFTEGDLLTKARDESINDPFDKVFDGESAGNFVNSRMARSEIPLTEFGGNPAWNPSPLRSITEQFGTTAHQYANSFYTYRAMQGWIDQVRLMQKEGINLGIEVPDNISKFDYRKLFLNTKLTGSTPEAARMREIQAIIKRRLGMTDVLTEQLRLAGDTLTEAIFDSWGKKVSVGDPTAPLLKTGFFAAFSFNLSQLFMQSSQVINTIAIVGPRIGTKALASSTHLRIIASSIDDVAVEQQAVRNFARAFELSDQDAADILELFRQIRPDLVQQDAIELGTGLQNGRSVLSKFGPLGIRASKVGQAIWDVGLIPFNLGDSTAKANAFMASVLEFRAKNAGVSLTSEAARNYIARRSEVLTQNMSNTSRSAIQSGLGKVPTQWLSYFFRSMEQVWIGRDLSLKERASLGFFTMPFYGFTGMGMGYAAESVAEVFGLDPNNDEDKALFISLKYGILDGFLNYFTPFDVALGERLASVTALSDIYDKFTEENVLSAIGGPSGSIAYTGIESLYNFMSNIANGYTSTLEEDTLRILRNFSGINNLAKAAGILQDGIYRNRRGIQVPVEVDEADAIISLTGFTPIQVTEFYGQTSRYIDLSKDYNAIRKEIQDRSRLAWGDYVNDPKKSEGILKEAQVIISKAPLSYDKKVELLRLLNPPPNDFNFILRNLYENDKDNAARWARSLMEKD